MKITSRSAQTFATLSVGLYIAWMMAIPCMPLADTAGEILGVPRWEYWVIHASVPSTVWWRWTGGLQPIEIFDRVPILGLAAMWLGTSWWLGRVIARRHRSPVVSPAMDHLISVLAGHALLGCTVFVNAWFFGIGSLWSYMLFVGPIVLLLYHSRYPLVQKKPSHDTDEDVSLKTSAGRRLVGVLFVACAWLAIVQIYGACIASADRDLRTTDWWLVKHAMDDGELRYRGDNLLSNAPSLSAMPALGLASVMQAFVIRDIDDSHYVMQNRKDRLDRLYLSVLAGKAIHATLTVIGISVIGLFLKQRFGILPGLIAAFCLLSTPGIAELARLGRTEAMAGVWSAAMLVFLSNKPNIGQSVHSFNTIFVSLVVGAMATGYGTLVLVALPALWIHCFVHFHWKNQTPAKSTLDIGFRKRERFAIAAAVCIGLLGASCYVRNALSSGDPFVPWSSVAIQGLGLTERTQPIDRLLKLQQIRADLDESDSLVEEAVNQDRFESRFGWEYFVGGLFSLTWASNAHGLLLIPSALLGIGLWVRTGRKSEMRFAILWALYWISIWWIFSQRFHRDWIGVLFLLAWPAASYVRWHISRSKSLGLVVLVWFCIVWSVLVLPIWPTSDNRMLVRLQNMRSNNRWYSFRNDDAVAKPNFESRLLLVGDQDDFDELVTCYVHGPVEPSVWDRIAESSSKNRGQQFAQLGVTHVFVNWTGVQERNRLRIGQSESKVREILDEMLKAGQIRIIGPVESPANGDLFQVIAD